jgi:hypothetical protein
MAVWVFALMGRAGHSHAQSLAFRDTPAARSLAWKKLAAWGPLAECAAIGDEMCVTFAKAVAAPAEPPERSSMLVPFPDSKRNGYLLIVNTFWQSYFVYVDPDLAPHTFEVGGGKGGSRLVSRQPIVVETTDHPGTGLFTFRTWRITLEHGIFRVGLIGVRRADAQ